ncbi:mechanosensitive ion channel family protein [Flavihumibacter stibioxidans]|uniref:Mechanosensitive ion channel protein MscS n=1 Tax=Flavihumibacter stibioxidans TaxID=1834163 RepID=A0ABR7MCU2_9BACT|nr:mechanosensitive ion channel domain-containing protein [Flavihumibacter stibioxidans]MBC6492767.1 hypothetical protein [Flavihumibacter stibioxidans]
MKEYLNQELWGNTYLAYLLALGGILVAWIIIRLLKKYAVRTLQKLVAGTDNQYDDMAFLAVQKYIIPLVYFFVNYNIITQLNLSSRIERILQVAITVIAIYYVVRIINHLMEGMMEGVMKKRDESPERIRQMKGVLMLVKGVIWFLGIVALLDNLGYDVATIIAGLGIGGIAIALAAQTILGDLFNYFVIFFDKPFEIGDFVNSDGKSGTVEFIGIKTTRIRSLNGEQIVLSNSKITSAALHNFKRMERRRVVFSIGVTYQTAAALLKEIPGLVEAAIRAQPNISFDRAHLASFGDYSINFEVVYYVDNPDYLTFMNAHQAVLQQIFESFELKGIEFAYPTQTLFLEGTGANGVARTQPA